MKKAITGFIEWFIPDSLRLNHDSFRRANIEVIFCFLGNLFFLLTAIKYYKLGDVVLATNVAAVMGLVLR